MSRLIRFLRLVVDSARDIGMPVFLVPFALVLRRRQMAARWREFNARLDGGAA